MAIIEFANKPTMVTRAWKPEHADGQGLAGSPEALGRHPVLSDIFQGQFSAGVSQIFRLSMFTLCSEEGMRVVMADRPVLPKRRKCSRSAWWMPALALGMVLAPGGAWAMPDHPWCRNVGDMRFDQVDRLSQVSRAVSQRHWDLLPGLFSREFPVPAGLVGRDRIRTLRAFHSVQLISASARGDLRAVDRLLAAGADPNVEGNLDYIATPLAMAALCDRPAVARRLIRGGARVNYRFSYANTQSVREGTTALMWASLGGSLSMVRLLLSRSARTDLRDSVLMHGNPPREPGATALDYSLRDYPNSRAIQRLLRARMRMH
jgi:hypothetical protein